jgi:transcriptional regulator with XRE-family HTH domain
MRKSAKSARASDRLNPLAETLKAWRSDRGLSAAAAADRLEISVRTLEGIEQGRSFRYEKILRLALNSA